MFRGEISHNIDSKGRLIVPVKFREQLGEHFIITKGLDKCLFAFPLGEWGEFEDKVKKLPISDPSVRRFVRQFIGGAFDTEIDAQGRTVLPQKLREYASIQKEIVMVGAIGRLELWSAENWKAYNDDGSYDDEMAVKLAQFGI